LGLDHSAAFHSKMSVPRRPRDPFSLGSMLRPDRRSLRLCRRGTELRGADAIKFYLPRGRAAKVLVTSNAHAWCRVGMPVEIELWPKGDRRRLSDRAPWGARSSSARFSVDKYRENIRTPADCCGCVPTHARKANASISEPLRWLDVVRRRAPLPGSRRSRVPRSGIFQPRFVWLVEFRLCGP
jgi:hypothetical protein